MSPRTRWTRPPRPARRGRYVVVVPQGLGDTLEATPFLRALRDAEPRAEIIAVVLRAAARDLIAETQLADRVVYLPYWDRGLGIFLLSALKIPLLARADAAFLMYPAARLVYLALLAIIPARRRFAHRYDDAWIRRFFDLGIAQVPIGPRHNVLRNGDLFEPAGIEPTMPARYVVPERWSATEPRRLDRIVIHVGTIAHDGLEARRWPPESFAELGRRLIARRYAVVFLAGPAELEITGSVARAVPGSRVATHPLAEAAALIASSRVVVANDSGIAHVAAGCGTPVLALFGPTPVEHGPYGAGSVAFRPTLCPPCFDVVTTDSRCKLDIDYACLKRDLTVDLVERRLLELIEATNPEGTASRR